MKKHITSILIITLLISGVTTAYAAAPKFSDVATSNWAYDAVNTMSAKAVIKGYPDGTFKPDKTVSCGEFIKMALITATGTDIGNAASGNWATTYYNEAIKLAYFTGEDIGAGALSYGIKRSQMALIISKILGEYKIDNYDKLREGITDIDVKTLYEYDITKAYASGILTGYPDKTFRPDGTLTRAEAATVIQRLSVESKRVKPVVAETAPPDGSYIPSAKNSDPTKETGIREIHIAETAPGVYESVYAEYKLVNTADYIDLSTLKNVALSDGSNPGDFTEKAEYYVDPSKLDIKINREWEYKNAEWGCSFDHRLSGSIYLVKDKKLIAYCPTLARWDMAGNFLFRYGSSAEVDVRTADYIVAVFSNQDISRLAMIVPNPLKK